MMEAAVIMRAIILLTFIGSYMVAASVPSRDKESSLKSAQDSTTLNAHLPQEYILYKIPKPNPANGRTIPTAVFANGIPTIAYVPSTYHYFQTPYYDVRYPFDPAYSPGSKPSIPEYVPKPERPQPPYKPTDDDVNFGVDVFPPVSRSPIPGYKSRSEILQLLHKLRDDGGVKRLEEKAEPVHD